MSHHQFDTATMEDLRQYHGLTSDDTSRDNEINAMSSNEAFCAVCLYHGLGAIGYNILLYVENILGVNAPSTVGEPMPGGTKLTTTTNHRYARSVYMALRERLGYDADDNTHDDEIDALEPRRVFDEFITYRGMINYSPLILEWIDGCYGTDLSEDYREHHCYTY